MCGLTFRGWPGLMSTCAEGSLLVSSEFWHLEESNYLLPISFRARHQCFTLENIIARESVLEMCRLEQICQSWAVTPWLDSTFSHYLLIFWLSLMSLGALNILIFELFSRFYEQVYRTASIERRIKSLWKFCVFMDVQSGWAALSKVLDKEERQRQKTKRQSNEAKNEDSVSHLLVDFKK